jgi:hypothetical protein
VGRLFEFKPGFYGWALEEPEERLLIAAYHDAEPRIPGTVKWKAEFLLNFYQLGTGVTHYTVDALNTQLRRLGKDQLTFVETNPDEYARNPDRPLKAELRCKLRDNYLALDTAGIIQFVNAAKAAVELLDPPHTPYEKHKEQQRQLSAGTDLQVVEIQRRKAALTTSKTKPKSDDDVATDRAMVLLRLTRSPETAARIIDSLTPDAAFAATQREGVDPEILEQLILRALEANGDGVTT